MGCVLQKSKSQTLESVMCVDILKMCEDQCIQICMWSHSYPWLPTILSQNIPLLFSRVLLSLLRVTGRYSLHHARYHLQTCIIYTRSPTALTYAVGSCETVPSSLVATSNCLTIPKEKTTLGIKSYQKSLLLIGPPN